MHVCSVVSYSATSWPEACQAPLSLGFPRQEHWSRPPLPSLRNPLNPGFEKGFLINMINYVNVIYYSIYLNLSNRGDFSHSYIFTYFWAKSFFNLFCWNIVDSQCCLNFGCTTKWFSYIYSYFNILFCYDLSQDTEYSSLCYTVGPCCLSILYITACIC